MYCVKLYSEPVEIVTIGGGITTAIVKVAVAVPELLVPDTVYVCVLEVCVGVPVI